MTAAKQLDKHMIEAALTAMDFDWLCDKHGIYQLEMAAADDHGGIRTRYEFHIEGEAEDVLVMRLRAMDWFAGVSNDLLGACNTWNLRTMLPTGALIVDDEGDSCLMLEHCVALAGEPVTQGLIEHSVGFFCSGCGGFLVDHAELLLKTQRFEPNNNEHTVH
jgi:hypothetical protein